MKQPMCAVCQNPALAVAVKGLRADGSSLTAIAERVKHSRSSINRHLKHSETPKGPDPTKPSSRGRGGLTFQTKRGKAGRCTSCGLSMAAGDAESLMRRAERLLWLAETIAAQAHADEDSRLALQAVDRARSALETMMRASGMIGGDGLVVNVDARRLEASLAQLSVEELRALATGKGLPAPIEAEAC